MGGNVFKGKTRRYEAAEYFALVKELTPFFERAFTRFEVVKAYATKPSFGDMDVLYTTDRDLTKVFKEFFSEVSKNGNVTSVLYKDFQVDLIHAPENEFEYSLSYLNFNDLGNLKGKIAHKFGLKHGHDGLTLPVRHETYMLGEVVLTRDPKKTNEFLNFKDGDFQTLEEIFESVVASKHFSKSVFAFENMNATARIRDKKRSTYNAFLKYLETVEDDGYTFPKDKSVHLPMVFEAFPEAKAEYDALWARKAMVDEVRAKFNANLVTELRGLEYKALGEFMRRFKVEYDLERLHAMTAEEVKKAVLDFDYFYA